MIFYKNSGNFQKMHEHFENKIIISVVSQVKGELVHFVHLP